MSDISSFIETTKTASQWKKVGICPHHGIALPLWALRSKRSCGIGDFGDLPPLIDWCIEVGFDCIQLLPLTDSGDDPSPYNSLSSCALNPIYLNLHDLPDSNLDQALFAPLTDLPRLPYTQVKREKMQWLFKYYERAFSAIQNTPEYKTFLEENNSWLDDYSLFTAVKDEYGGKRWQEWPPEKSNRQTCQANPRAIDFHRFLQYHCQRQMTAVKKYAEDKQFLIKGDIPIAVSPDSVDVWAAAHLFNMKYAAGAPPDVYTPQGQRWGFPIFNWDAMRTHDFAWWRRRIKAASRYFRLYRIDHFVGLFRIWGFPIDEPNAKGQFIPADRALWDAQGRDILDQIIPLSDMLPMAENLGEIPKVVTKTMHEYGICGMTVIRWQRHWEKNCDYIAYDQYEPLSMTTVSTHDSEPLQLWWRDLPEDATRFAEFKHWTYEPELAIWQRKEILRDSHHTPALFHLNQLQEYLALFPELVSTNPEDERINVPGTVLPNNWTYRFKPTLEEIVSHRDLAAQIKNIIST